jgi:type I restriction enzyme S subunit
MKEQTQLPILPLGWVRTTLGAVTEDFIEQGGPNGREEFLYIDISSIDNKSKRITKPKLLPVASAPSRAKQRLKIHDVLVSMTRPNLNAVAIVPEAMKEGIGSTGFKVLRTRWISPFWIYYVVQTHDFVDAMSSLVQGALYPAIRPRDVESFQIPLPPLDEQQRIVDEIEKQFSRLDAAVETLEIVERNLEHLYAATLKAAIEGRLVPTEADLARAEGRQYEPADVLLQRILRERRAKWEADQIAKMKEQGKTPKDDKWKDKYPEPAIPNISHTPELPKGWVWVNWAQVGLSQNGRSFPSREYQSEGVKLLRPGNLHVRGRVVWTNENTRYLPEHWAKQFPNFIVGPKELVMNLTAQSLKDEFLGRVCLTGDSERCLLNQRIARLMPIIIMPEYLLWMFKSKIFRRFVDGLNTGSLIQHMFTSQLDAFILPLPPLAEQRRIVAEVERHISVIEELKALVANSLRRVAVLRRTILRDAFVGKLVPHVHADESAETLLERIRQVKAESEKIKKKPLLQATTKTSRKKSKARKRAIQELPLFTKGGKEVENQAPVRARDIKLIRLKLDGEYKALLNFDQRFRVEGETRSALSPVCLVGLNGSGKSNLIEALSEIFCYLELINLPYEGITHRAKQKDLDFEIEYELPGKGSQSVRFVKVSKQGNQPPTFIERVGDEETQVIGDAAQLAVLPTWIIGYSSGLNETISIPYFKTKAFYSEDVRNRAFNISKREQRTETFTESRTLFMDYDSNAAILIANYIFGSRNQLDVFRERIRIDDIASFDVVIRLKYGGNKPVKLTAELAEYIRKLRECASNSVEDADKQSTLSYEVDAKTRQKIRDRFDSAKDFFIALYKLSLLNALALKGEDRKFYLRPDVKEGLLERPPTVSKSDKIFDIDRLKLKLTEPSKVIDYAGISDGEHQFIHIFGTIKLFDDSGTLFLFDEPETHFNPRWRREFVELLNAVSATEKQEFVISTHSPYIVSGCRKENVFKFERKGDRAFCLPVDFETYGSSFEYLLTKLFDLDSLISKQAFEEMRNVIKSKDLNKLEAAVNDFGESFEKRFLFEEIARAKKRG